MTTAGIADVAAQREAGPRDSTLVAAVAVIVAGVLLELLLLAAIPVFVTTDGAAHVDGAEALAQLLFGGGPSVPYTTLSWLPATNLVPEVPMAVLTAIVGAPTAEKLVLGAWVVLLPAALWYAVTGVRRGAGWLAVLALPLTFGLILQLGFYSFCFATLLFLAVAGDHARHREAWTGPQVGVLAVLLTLTYATHAFVFLVAGLLLVVLEGWTWAVDGPRTARGLGIRLGRVLVAALPALVLVGAAMLASGRAAGSAGTADGPAVALQVRAFLEAALWILPLAVFDHREAAPALLVSLLAFALGVVAILARRDSRPLRSVDGYLAFVALLLVGILLVPDSATLGAGGPGAFVTSRLAEFVPLATVLWLAAFPFGSRARVATIAVAGVAAVLLIGIRWSWYQRLSDQAVAFASLAPCVAEGATMAQVNLSRFELPSNRTDQIENETGRLSAPTRGLDLGDAELGDGVHLVRYRADVDPYRYLRQPGGLPETVDPVIDPDAYAAATGGSLDYVLVYGRPEMNLLAVAESAPWQRLEGQLQSSYRLVATVDDGRLELYERLGTDVAEAGAARRAGSNACAEIGGG
jgi:hypothetical protein